MCAAFFVITYNPRGGKKRAESGADLRAKNASIDAASLESVTPGMHHRDPERGTNQPITPVQAKRSRQVAESDHASEHSDIPRRIRIPVAVENGWIHCR